MADEMLDVPPEIDEVIDDQWRRLGEPGTWLTGPERVALVTTARSEPDPADRGSPSTLDAVARLVAHRAAAITSDTVDAIDAAGIDRTTYAEVVGIVSRVAAIDTFELGIGRNTRPLPVPVGGVPTREPVGDARRRAGWVATVGAINPATALTSVRREAADQQALADVLYLSLTGMLDHDADRGLHRTQMELVATRVSLLNDCFY